MTQAPANQPVVRQAEYDDIPAMVEHARLFYAASEKPRPFNPAWFAEWLYDSLENPAFIFLVTDTGSCGMVVAPFHFSGEGHALELWLWDHGRRGAALIDQMIRECKLARSDEGHGVSILGFTTQDNMRGAALGRFLEMKGFQKAESVYVLDLTKI